MQTKLHHNLTLKIEIKLPPISTSTLIPLHAILAKDRKLFQEIRNEWNGEGGDREKISFFFFC